MTSRPRSRQASDPVGLALERVDLVGLLAAFIGAIARAWPPI